MNNPNLLMLELVAWVGEDEFGSGQIGLKQAMCPAGIIPMASIAAHEGRLRAVKPQMETQASLYGKQIFLCRFTFTEILDATGSGRGGGLVAPDPHKELRRAAVTAWRTLKSYEYGNSSTELAADICKFLEGVLHIDPEHPPAMEA